MFKDNLRLYRRYSGMSEEELGAKCGVTGADIVAYESNDSRPGMETIERIASVLGIRPVDLISRVSRCHVTRAFDDYVAGYDMADEKIRLKAEHTYKVAALCDMIAGSLGLPGGDRDVAWLCGMLHDIGRFEQVRRWGTFYDSQSVNHAEFGADLLFRDGLIGRFVADGAVDPALEPAIRNHNRLHVDSSLDARTRMFCDILRDADKVDIIRVNVESPVTEIYNAPMEGIRASAISPEVEAGFYERRCIDSALKRTVADRMVGHFAFVFELVYPASIAEVERQGLLWQAMGFEFTNSETAAKVAAMRDEMRAFLDEWQPRPNAVTEAAMEEARAIAAGEVEAKRFGSVADAIDSLER